MKTHLKFEEFAQFLFGIFLFSKTVYSWWFFSMLFLLPDIGMLGYVINTKVGAITYNIFHSKIIAVFLLVFGMYFSINTLELAGIIFFSHASLDRFFGYGLKYFDSFKNTHHKKLN